MNDLEKLKMLDGKTGRPRTQSLFLEVNYGPEAIYTLKDNDHEWNGKVYPSLKRLYLEMEDATEYEFASTYLLGWKHWVRIYENKLFKHHVEEWREELEFKLRSRAVKQMLALADAGNYQASKWVLDRGWQTRGAGRPTKTEVESQKRIQERIADEYSADVHRLFANQGK